MISLHILSNFLLHLCIFTAHKMYRLFLQPSNQFHLEVIHDKRFKFEKILISIYT